jgi:hypothetical protein
VKDLPDGFVLGKILVLPANVRLGLKGNTRYKHSSLFGLGINYEEKSFITITSDASFRKPFSSSKISWSVCTWQAFTA